MLFGLAMHGQPKYDANAAHLDYANPDAPKGGKLKIAAIGTFDTLNPFSIKGKAAQGLNLVYDRLMARVWDEPFTTYPLIARSVEIPEDRSSITVHINPKARFHDGSPITADDVIFSFETLKASGRPNMRQIYRLVDQVIRRDPLTVYFHFGEGYDRETAMIIARMPVLSKAYWEGRTFDQTTLDIPVLNGPYRIKDFDAGRRITYERVPDYWAKDLLTNVGHHNFDEITYEYYRDDTVAFEAFKTGDLSLRREWDAGKWASAYDFPAAKDGHVKLEALPHGRPERARALIFNTRRTPFDDIRVRKALNLLFDFEWINKNIFHGQYKRSASFFPNSELAATGTPQGMELDILNLWRNDLPPEIFDSLFDFLHPTDIKKQSPREKMRQADQMLKDAGWIVENGKRVKDGQPFSFEIIVDAPENEKIALHFKRALEKMGIEVLIRVLDAAAYRGRLNEYDFDMTIYYWLSSLSPGTEQNLYWTCKAANEPARWNFPGICSPTIDALAGSIASSETREELVARMRALDRILVHGHYIIPLYYSGVDYVGYWPPITSPETTPLYGMVIETWWMPGKN
ncbi:MAG TPA: extracellular solute-binding protein [Alphaproteobacteria bacterium]|nr:extracellular solute-binding protein [Alphaproteobacteria bacterium]